MFLKWHLANHGWSLPSPKETDMMKPLTFHREDTRCEVPPDKQLHAERPRKLEISQC